MVNKKLNTVIIYEAADFDDDNDGGTKHEHQLSRPDPGGNLNLLNQFLFVNISGFYLNYAGITHLMSRRTYWRSKI